MIAEIKGVAIQLDKEDIRFVTRYTWSLDKRGVFHRGTTEGGVYKSYLLHREIMGNPIGKIVDFSNGDRYDFRKCNLVIREVTKRQKLPPNSPSRPNRSNKCGFRGVYYDGKRSGKNKWRARITIDGKRIHLGRYPTPEKAHEAYVEAYLLRAL